MRISYWEEERPEVVWDGTRSSKYGPYLVAHYHAPIIGRQLRSRLNLSAAAMRETNIRLELKGGAKTSRELALALNADLKLVHDTVTTLRKRGEIASELRQVVTRGGRQMTAFHYLVGREES